MRRLFRRETRVSILYAAPEHIAYRDWPRGSGHFVRRRIGGLGMGSLSLPQDPEQPPSSLPPSSVNDILTDLLQHAGVCKSSTIRVTGPAGLAALLWFCRHGYEQVGYVRAGPCPAEDGDLVLAPQTCDLPTLAAILARGPHPRAGGVLIVQTPIPDVAPGAVDPVHDLLEQSGYRVERCVRGHHRELHVARRGVWSSEREAA
jgi:hypothetical protein